MKIDTNTVNTSHYSAQPSRSLSIELKEQQKPPTFTQTNTASSVSFVDPIEQHKKMDALAQQSIDDFVISFREYQVEMEKTQDAILSSLNEFEAFKNHHTVENPAMDLTNLDLYQEKDGTLKLSSDILTDKELSTLERDLNKNEELRLSMTMIHKGAALAHSRPDSNNTFSPQDFYGTLRLNDLTQRFNNQFNEEGFGQTLVTLEERINIDPIFFTDYLISSVSPKINVSV